MQKDIEKLQSYQEYRIFLRNLAKKLELSPLKRSRPQTSKFVNTRNLPIRTTSQLQDPDFAENRSSNNQSELSSTLGKPPKSRQTLLREGIKQTLVESAFRDYGPDINIPEQIIGLINEGEDEDFELDDLDEMAEIFLEMENKNLFIIQQLQETEATLEERKHEFELQKSISHREISKLEKAKEQVGYKLSLSNQEIQNLTKLLEVQETKDLD